MRGPTQQEIGAALGLSQGTVSRALRDPGTARVSAENKRRIRLYLAERARADEARAAGGRALALVPAAAEANGNGNEVLRLALPAAEVAAAALGLDLTVRSYATGSELPALQQTGDHRGLLLAGYLPPALLEHLCAAGPVVLLGQSPQPDVPCDAVGIDNLGGVVRAVRHLIAHGHRRIAWYGPDFHANRSDRVVQTNISERQAGWHAGHLACGLAPDARLCCLVSDDPAARGALTFQHTRDVLDHLRQLAEPATAVICYNDDFARHVVRTAIDQGLRVPYQLSVVGFRSTVGGDRGRPRLTTITQHAEEVGRLAVHRLLQRIRGDDTPPLRLACATTLLDGATVHRRGDRDD